MALPEMAGDADQAVLLLIPRKGDAIIGLEAGLVSPEDGGAVLLFEDHGAAEIGGVGFAAALVIDDEKRLPSARNLPLWRSGVSLTSQRLPLRYDLALLQADPLMLAASQNVASSGRSAFGRLVL